MSEKRSFRIYKHEVVGATADAGVIENYLGCDNRSHAVTCHEVFYTVRGDIAHASQVFTAWVGPCDDSCKNQGSFEFTPLGGSEHLMFYALKK